jgi:hypothetical protein
MTNLIVLKIRIINAFTLNHSRGMLGLDTLAIKQFQKQFFNVQTYFSELNAK